MVITIIILLIVIPFLIGWNGALEFTFMLELKKWNNPYMELGMQFNVVPLQEGFYEEEFILSFIFFNVVVIFLKEGDII